MARLVQQHDLRYDHAGNATCNPSQTFIKCGSSPFPNPQSLAVPLCSLHRECTSCPFRPIRSLLSLCRSTRSPRHSRSCTKPDMKPTSPSVHERSWKNKPLHDPRLPLAYYMPNPDLITPFLPHSWHRNCSHTCGRLRAITKGMLCISSRQLLPSQEAAVGDHALDGDPALT